MEKIEKKQAYSSCTQSEISMMVYFRNSNGLDRPIEDSLK
jgi:hypothetical protein